MYELRGWVGVRVVLAVSLGALLSTSACEGTHREFASTGDGGPSQQVNPLEGQGGGDGGASLGTSGRGGSASTPVLAQLGDSCTAGSECELSHCVDGVCCDSPCADLCATCAAPGSEGTCSPAPSDVACDAVSCPGATECRGRDQTALALNCTGVGSCRTDVVCAPLDTPSGESCQAGTGTCDGAGACNVPGKASLGEACTIDTDCAEGHCIEGADGSSSCCDAACDGPCQQCSTEGHCDAFPTTDNRCEPVICPPDNPCRAYPDTLTDALCQGFDRCRTVQSCEATELRPLASCDCDASGSCSLREGVACTAGTECTSGACVPNIAGATTCCTTACGPGLSCAADGRGCVECLENTVACDGTTALRCVEGRSAPEACANGCTPGTGCNTLAPLGFSCAAVECAPGAVCQPDVNGTERCCARDCAAEGKQCAADGSCVCPPGQSAGTADNCLLQQGDPCSAGGTACGAALTCVDGVCCAGACNAACESCNLQGSVGTCSFNLNDTAACPGGEQCVARNDCRGALRQACTGAQDCALGNCEPVPGASGANICCEDSCGGQTGFCSTDGTRCVQCQSNADCDNGCDTASGLCNALRRPGDTCSVAGQCSTNTCIPDATSQQINRCCPNCAAGQLCTAQGTCQNPPLGAGDSCQSEAQCTDILTCRDGVCCSSACNGLCQNCGGNGACNVTPATDSACPPLNCGQSTECRTVTAPASGACSALGQCAQCITRNTALGTDCGADGDCDNAGACQPNRTAPTVIANSLRGTAVGIDRANLIFTAASDDRTAAAQLEYAVFQAETNILNVSAAQLVTGVAGVNLLRAFAVGSDVGALVLPRARAEHFFRVVVRDRSGNVTAYDTTRIAFAEPESCTAPQDCISGTCLTLFLDADEDCRGTPTTTIRRCTAPTSSTAGCSAPTSALVNFASAQVNGARYVNNNDDCLDINESVYEQQPGFFPTAFAVPAGSPAGAFANGFDYNCSGQPEPGLPIFGGCANSVPQTSPSNGNCTNASAAYPMGSQNVPCGAPISVNFCADTDLNGTCTLSGQGNLQKQCH